MYISLIIHTLVECFIGWLCIQKIPSWLNLRGIIATIVKIIGVLIIIGSLLSWL